MKVIAKYFRGTHADLTVWARSLPGRGWERRELAEFLLNGLLRYLEQLGGPPPGAVQEAGIAPPTWWWHYDTHFWIRFCVEDERPPWYALWKKPVRRITIVRVRDRPDQNQ